MEKYLSWYRKHWLHHGKYPSQ